MYKEGSESWRIVVSSDMTLNFALFTGCLYGLIEADNVKGEFILWPSKYFNDKLPSQSPLLKEQWNEWFNNMVKSFNLYIDLVYTGTSQIIEANNEYIVMIPVGPIYYDKDWWMNKLQEIG